MEFDPTQPQNATAAAAPSSLSSSDWTMVLSDFRRAVSNLVLYVLESVPFPANASPQMFALQHSGRNEGDGPRHQQPYDLGNFQEEWFLSDPPAPLQPLPTALAQLPGRFDIQPPPLPPTHTDVIPAAKPAPKRAPPKKKSVPVAAAATAAVATFQ